MDDSADDGLPLSILRMGPAGHDELDRAIPVTEDSLQTIRVIEDKRAPFVGGEPARKADGQGPRVKNLVGKGGVSRRGAPRFQLGSQPAPSEGHQAFPSTLVGPPQLLGGNALNAGPNAGV
jgi:hypothetical protein